MPFSDVLTVCEADTRVMFLVTILSGVNKMPVLYFIHFSLLQDVRLIHFSSPKLQYSPGDVLMVCPHNAQEKVDQFFSLLSCGSDGRLRPDAMIQVTEKDSDASVPLALKHPLTLRKCAEQYWDLNVSMKMTSVSVIVNLEGST
jgi:sulfite reductase alpha subunit-like flavoprotein